MPKELQKKIIDVLEQGGVRVEGIDPPVDQTLSVDFFIRGSVQVKVLQVTTTGVEFMFIVLSQANLPLWEFGPVTIEQGGTYTIGGIEVKMAGKLTT